MKKPCDPQISRRAAEAVLQLSRERDLTVTEVCKMLDIEKKSFYAWYHSLYSPQASALAALAEHGMDVMYILTGRREGGQVARATCGLVTRATEKAASDAATSEAAEEDLKARNRPT